MSKSKNAIVLSGGGMKGAYAIGFLEELLPWLQANNYDFQIVTSTSTGSLINPALATKDINLIKKLADIYQNTSTKDIFSIPKTIWMWGWRLLLLPISLIFKIFPPTGLLDGSPLKKTIGKVITPEIINKLKNYKKTNSAVSVINMVNIETGALAWCTQNKNEIKKDFKTKNKNGIPKNELIDFKYIKEAMLASASQPPAFKPVKINNYHYTDGGIRDITPFGAALAAGATSIFSIILSPEDQRIPKKEYKNLFSVSLRYLDIVTTEIAKNDIEIINLKSQLSKHSKKYKNIDLLPPIHIPAMIDYKGKKIPLPSNDLDFNKGIMRALYKMGKERFHTEVKNKKFRDFFKKWK